jgi:hypothetical protein
MLTTFHSVRLEQAEQSASVAKNVGRESPEDDEDEETFVSRFVSRLLNWILRGFLAKDKNVRYRSVFSVSEMILWLGPLEWVYLVLFSGDTSNSLAAWTFMNRSGKTLLSG